MNLPVEAVDLVLPILGRDIARLRPLLASLEKFWHVPGDRYAITRDDPAKRKQVSAALGPKWTVVGESSVLPCLRKKHSHYNGWLIQQLLKLYSSRRLVSSPYFLTLDADCVVMRLTEYADVIKEGKAPITMSTRETSTSYHEWYLGSADALQLNLEQTGIGYRDSIQVTPAFLCRDLCRELVERIDDLYTDGGCYLCQRGESFGGGHFWTEYTMYHILAATRGSLWDLHWKHPCIIGPSVWLEDAFDAWTVEQFFTHEEPLFAVLQSNTKIDPERIWNKVNDFLKPE